MARSTVLVSLSLAIAVPHLLACNGEVVDPTAGALCPGGPSPGPAPLRRLTHAEYDNTVRDLLGDDSRPSDAFPSDTSAVGFDNQAQNQTINPLLAEHYLRAAETLSARAVGDLDALLPCDPADEDACARAFVEQFGKRAFRRALTADEVSGLLAVFEAGSADGFSAGIELVIQAALQSPKFLFRLELGPGGATPLSGYDMASRLSYFLWSTMPDDELFAAAERGELRSPSSIADHARRMLADPKARENLASFHDQWLELAGLELLDKDPVQFPEFDDELAASAREETLRFLDHVVFDGEGDLRTMLLADYSFVDDRLAAHYGLAAPDAAFGRVSLPANERTGILTHASILALTSKPNQSSPVQRGLFVRERLLCQTLPEPPPNVDTTPPVVDPNSTVRERYSQHSTDPACSGCHQLIDPIGFGFGHYDAIGRWRDTENGLPIDATGEVLQTFDGDIAFDGAPELATRLADSQQVRECFVDQWFTFANGRAPIADDACTIDWLRAQFDESDGDVVELMVAITQTDAFRFRPAR